MNKLYAWGGQCCYTSEHFRYRDPEKEDIQAAQKGLKEVKEIMCSGKYQMIFIEKLKWVAR